MIHPFRVVKYGLQNLITWFPVIWNDRQWDQFFLLTILRKKLSLMEKYFRNNSHHVGSGKDADNMKTVICLIDRLIKDDYMNSAFVPHKKKYGESEIIWKDIPGTKSVKMDIKYENQPETEQEKQEERELFLRCCNREEYLRYQDLTMLLSHLKKHLLTWWD